jgi:uncharacterized damage-inducible protein DinB
LGAFGCHDVVEESAGMTTLDAKDDLHAALKKGRAALFWKLDGLGEYDLRRPLTPTGTNLLGVLKHVATMEALYFGRCFGRPFDVAMPWIEDDAEPNADMWATQEESRSDIVGFYQHASAHADGTIASLALDTVGDVDWWEVPQQTLHKILVHMIAETHRHAGQSDIVRELVDASAGFQPGDPCLPEVDERWWAAYRSRLEQVASQATATH